VTSGCGSSTETEYHEYQPEAQAETAVEPAAEVIAENDNPAEPIEAPGEEPSSDVAEPEVVSPPEMQSEGQEPVADAQSPAEPVEKQTKNTAEMPTPAEVQATKVSATRKSPFADDVPVEPRTPKLLVPTNEFRSEGPENALRVTFDDIDLLKVLNMEPVPEDAVKQFPDWLKELEGRRVRIRGFMFPTLSQTGITYFQHVRDNEICCFGRTPKVYDRISTVLRPGETTNYIQGRPFDVIGTFRIDPVYDDGEWLQLYLLEDAIVIN